MRRSVFSLIALLFIGAPAFAQQVRNGMLVSPEWLWAHWSSVVLLDVGSPAEFTAGHIPTAALLDFRRIVTTRNAIPNELPTVAELEDVFSSVGAGDRKRIVLYSRDPSLAARAWFTLDYLGHGNRASLLDGGLARWKSEGRRLTSDSMPVAVRAFHAVPQPAFLTSLGEMKHVVRWREIVYPRITLIDARPSSEYCGEQAGAGIDRAGHIAGAVNVAWNENFAEDGSFHAADVLRDLYAKAGASPRTYNIVYCRTGTHAAVSYFVLRYLGYDVSLYDGSYIEWSTAASTVVVERSGCAVPRPS